MSLKKKNVIQYKCKEKKELNCIHLICFETMLINLRTWNVSLIYTVGNK
jgi:hypothetical protein